MIEKKDERATMPLSIILVALESLIVSLFTASRVFIKV